MQATTKKEVWNTRIVVLVLSGIFASIANWINGMKAASSALAAGKTPGPVYLPWEVLPGIGIMFLLVVCGCLIDDFVKSNFPKVKLPTILYISMLAIIAGIPGLSPIANTFLSEVNKIGLLPLCTPILAFAGISLGKDIDGFRKQGIGIIILSLLTIAGVYVSGVVVAQLGLALFGQL